MANSVVATFLGALQASISVLLTIAYGVIATQWGLIDENSARNVSQLSVKVFLPALLLTNIGGELNHDSIWRYIPIVVWGLLYNSIFTATIFGVQKLFKLPTWITPACIFNNTTSFPLLLVQSLATTSIFKALLWHKDDTVDRVLERAVSYFLINSMISNSFTFGLGPMLVELDKKQETRDRSSNNQAAAQVARVRSDPTSSRLDLEDAIQQEQRIASEEVEVNEQTSLLPHSVNVKAVEMQHQSYKGGKMVWDKLPVWLQWPLDRIYAFISAPLIGAIIGVVIGLVPPLQRLFFNDGDNGGYFKAWLTVSAKNIGQLFPALQVVLVGIKLSKSLLALKRREASGNQPLSAVLLVIFCRFVLFPGLSISIIYVLALKTSILPDDPVLWFAMAIMHTGPPALELVSMADVNGADELEKLSISKLITICYTVSPIMAFSVVGALKAIEAAERQ